MAFLFISGDGYARAKEIAGDDQAKLIEEYKKTGQAYLEGTNEEIHNQPGYLRIMDEEKPKKAVKPAKKAKKSKK